MKPTLQLRRAGLAAALAAALALGAGAAPVSGASAAGAGSANAAPTDADRPQPARRSDDALHSLLLGSARAGTRIVAVGERGVVLLSDDDGKSYRQAAAVPVRSTLTAVSFADPQHGWAVGHDGVVLASADGGEHWTLQRRDTAVDQPLFSVLFTSASSGWACGLWSLLLHTDDGGQHWETVTLPAPDGARRADRNLYRLFADPNGALYIAAERGSVLRSADGGASWRYLDTGYRGSLWAGTALADGTLLVAGLRGSLYRSADAGASWQPVDSGIRSSITDLVASGRKIRASALDGNTLASDDAGASFSHAQRDDRPTLTTLVTASDGRALLFGRSGPLAQR
ncbi:WD40/YVTN/BNR-like repeat-containing protein [Derxia lacustris]|uniref:WD40/YVTN/BNR-like repeat-containing protein n=1 Tax=Derxia lacustris TaxID=764842 RepID=UPI000A16DC53|nr:YCF48-related protein [Derxia lacustris]